MSGQLRSAARPQMHVKSRRRRLGSYPCCALFPHAMPAAKFRRRQPVVRRWDRQLADGRHADDVAGKHQHLRRIRVPPCGGRRRRRESARTAPAAALPLGGRDVRRVQEHLRLPAAGFPCARRCFSRSSRGRCRRPVPAQQPVVRRRAPQAGGWAACQTTVEDRRRETSRHYTGSPGAFAHRAATAASPSYSRIVRRPSPPA